MTLPVGCVTAAKAERLRQAKAEAEKEISAYRAEREGAYQKKLAEVREHMGGGCLQMPQGHFLCVCSLYMMRRWACVCSCLFSLQFWANHSTAPRYNSTACGSIHISWHGRLG